jgi:phosphoribosyl-AMP cyclohydrolase / phosphoribosyl-ATP pyrophosphohydrolase
MLGALLPLHTNGYAESCNYLLLKDIKAECNNDTLLIKATLQWPICNTGADT